MKRVIRLVLSSLCAAAVMLDRSGFKPPYGYCCAFPVSGSDSAGYDEGDRSSGPFHGRNVSSDDLDCGRTDRTFDCAADQASAFGTGCSR